MLTIAKADSSLRSLADLREVSQGDEKEAYPIPKDNRYATKLEGFMYATSLDLNMGCYHVRLTPFPAGHVL